MNGVNWQELIDQAIELGGLIAREGFELTMRVAVAQGIFHAVILIIGISLLLWGLSAGKRNGWDWDYIWVQFGLGIALIWTSLYKAIMYLYVPEWRAIELIMDVARGGGF